MLICKGNIAYKCSNFRINTLGDTRGIEFDILEPAYHSDVANLFEDNGFYFYDEVLKARFADTNNTKLVGLSITYNANSTCSIKIKLTKGDVDNES